MLQRLRGVDQAPVLLCASLGFMEPSVLSPSTYTRQASTTSPRPCSGQAPHHSCLKPDVCYMHIHQVADAMPCCVILLRLVPHTCLMGMTGLTQPVPFGDTPDGSPPPRWFRGPCMHMCTLTSVRSGCRCHAMLSWTFIRPLASAVPWVWIGYAARPVPPSC